MQRPTSIRDRVANSLLSQELKLCFSDTKFTKAPYTKKDTKFFLDTKWDTEQYQILSQIPKSFGDIKSSISDTKMATLDLAHFGQFSSQVMGGNFWLVSHCTY